MFLSVLDTAGKRWKVGQGKSGKLKDKWHIFEHGVSIWLTIGKYNNYDYVEDTETCLDTLEVKAAKELADTMRNSKEESIECQVVVKAITDLEVASSVYEIKIPKDLLDARDNWLRYALRDYMGDKE